MTLLAVNMIVMREHVANGTEHWTQDHPDVWGLIHSADVMEKCLVNFTFHTVSVHPAIMGTWYTGSKVGSIVAGCISEEHICSHGWLDSKRMPLPLE